MVTFLREAMRPLGGPSGGDGGNGGSVSLVADPSLNTLLKFRYRQHFIASNGGHGARNRRRGADGEDVEVTVPCGTEVWRVEDDDEGTEAFLGDLIEPGQSMLVAQGGRGGLGNAAFVTPVNRQPLLAEAGEVGETRRLRLNLKILADVGIVGLPNAGKSSLLSAITAATPKIADYPFTTLEPVVGIVEHGYDAFAAVDIPGLIEGAAQGHGLGHEFLKHMQRTRLLIHVVDGSVDDVAESIRAINTELAEFDAALAERPQVIAINKCDLEEVEVFRSEIEAAATYEAEGGVTVKFVSAATREGLGELIDAVAYSLTDLRGADQQPDSVEWQTLDDEDDLLDRDDLPVIRPRTAQPTVFKRSDGAYRIVHDRAVRIARGSNLDNWEALVQFQQRLDRLRVSDTLKRAGAKTGDTILVDEWEFEWQ